MNGDRDRLQQVVWNLLSNAIKFTPNYGEVSIRLSHDAESCALEVRDTTNRRRPGDLPDRVRGAVSNRLALLDLPEPSDLRVDVRSTRPVKEPVT